MREIKAGDQVKFLNDVGTARVLRVEGNTVIVEDEDGFERSVERSELMDAGDRDLDDKKYGNKLPDVAQLLTQEVGERRMKELQRDFEVRYQSSGHSMSRRDAHMEVDLHIHELVDDQRGLADGAKLAIQMAHFDRMMDIAKREKLRRIVFIHGVGQGQLRHQIRTALDQHHPDCNYRKGDPRRYGSGATEVWLGQASWRKP